MFKVHQLTKSFRPDFWKAPHYALNNVSFHVTKGKATGFLGPNGAGKTTLIKILMGFIQQDSGDIAFSKDLGEGQTNILSQVGFVPERPYFHPHLKGYDFLTFLGRLSNVERNLLHTNIQKYSEELNISHALEREIRNYSKGMLQRLGFVSALLHDPQLLVLDEPLSGLDPIGRRELKGAMKRLVKEGKTVFFSSHIIPDIQEVCEDVVVLERGEVFYQGEIQKLVASEEKDLVDLVYFDDRGREKELVVESEALNDKLREVIQMGGKVQSVNRRRPTLEEIVYRE